MTRPLTPLPTEGPARRFGREIAAALASGTGADELTLHLTLMDASKIKRDPELPVEHISFSPAGMQFLGVRVVEGGVRSSMLASGEDQPTLTPAPEKPVKATKAKAASRKAPAATKAKSKEKA